MRRLATQIHATVVAVLALFAVLLGAGWWHGPGSREGARLAEGVAETAGEVLPGPERSVAELQGALERLAPRFGLDAAVFSPEGERLAWVGSPLTLPAGDGPRRHWTRTRGRVVFAVRLPDGRRLVASRPRPDWRHLGGVAATVALLALAVGLGAWPLVRRLTQRLERLRLRVDDLGRGDLTARAPVEGRDEVAARVEAAVEGEAVEVRGDPRLLRRLVRNLLENARRHGGTSVEARVARLETGARLTVADRGPGVAPTERERIFEPFYRPPGAPETGASYGLGLALVRQIARAHGGEARCQARESGGTVFEVILGA